MSADGETPKSLMHRALTAVEALPNSTRDQIAAHMQAGPVQTSNALRQLKEQDKAFCQFRGRFSTWSATPPVIRPAKAINSVWNLGLNQ
jgi:hypothetical protein